MLRVRDYLLQKTDMAVNGIDLFMEVRFHDNQMQWLKIGDKTLHPQLLGLKFDRTVHEFAILEMVNGFKFCQGKHNSR